jgi:hypothetical protein
VPRLGHEGLEKALLAAHLAIIQVFGRFETWINTWIDTLQRRNTPKIALLRQLSNYPQ